MWPAFRAFTDSLARLILLLVALGVAAYLGFDWLTSAPSPEKQLARANPGWTVELPRHGSLPLRDSGGTAELFIPTDEAGPRRLQRLDCAQVLPRLPTWLALPPGRTTGCLQLDGPPAIVAADAVPSPSPSPTLVLNHRTLQSIRQVWTQGYAPQLDELKLPHWGGTSGRATDVTDGTAAEVPGRQNRTLGYTIDPAHGSTGPQINLQAHYVANETLMIVTLRPPAPPSDSPAALPGPAATAASAPASLDGPRTAAPTASPPSR